MDIFFGIREISINPDIKFSAYILMEQDNKLLVLLEWIRNTNDDKVRPSTHSLISTKITVQNTEESGRGVYSIQEIRRREQLIRIPLSFLLNFSTAIAHITKHNPSITLDHSYSQYYVPNDEVKDEFTAIYGKLEMKDLLALTSFQILGLYLGFEQNRPNSFWKPFIDMLPQISDFDLCPLIWKILYKDSFEELFKLLPESTQKHSNAMIKRFQEDYDVVIKLLATIDEENAKKLLPIELFLWSWMCINSRCLYMEMAQGKTTADNFTMAPYVDFLNHSQQEQCTLKIDSIGFQVLASTGYSEQQQIFLSYGAHSNEFLMCEYGFILNEENTWDEIDISAELVDLMNQNQIDYLKEYDYFNDYTVNQAGVSFRTEVALAVLQFANPHHSRKLVALINGNIDTISFSLKSKRILTDILTKLIFQCEKLLYLEYVNDSDPVNKSRKQTIGKLHRQKMNLATKTLADIA